MLFQFPWKSLPNQVCGRIWCKTINSRKCEMIVSVRPYPWQRYNSIRRGCPAGDHEAGLMPVDTQDVRCWITGLHKWLVRICGTKKPPPKLVISKIQVSQKLHFKADEALYILSFRWTMICTDLQLLHWRSCYGTTEISSAIESGWCEGIQNRDQISDQFTLSFLGFFFCKCNRKEEEREGMTCS